MVLADVRDELGRGRGGVARRRGGLRARRRHERGGLGRARRRDHRAVRSGRRPGQQRRRPPAQADRRHDGRGVRAAVPRQRARPVPRHEGGGAGDDRARRRLDRATSRRSTASTWPRSRAPTRAASSRSAALAKVAALELGVRRHPRRTASARRRATPDMVREALPEALRGPEGSDPHGGFPPPAGRPPRQRRGRRLGRACTSRPTRAATSPAPSCSSTAARPPAGTSCAACLAEHSLYANPRHAGLSAFRMRQVPSATALARR